MILTDKNKVKEILNFNDECTYMIMAKARKKDNEGLTNSQEIVFREIVNSEKQFDRKYDRLIKIINNDLHNFKLYITYNPRSILKAYSLLKQRFCLWDDELIKNAKSILLHSNTINRVGRIHNEWISCLQKPASCYKKNYFMLDVDNKLSSVDEDKILEEIYSTCDIDKDTIKVFETQNGHHILFPPCDTRKLMESLGKYLDVELKRDALVCIGYYKK